MLLTTYGMVLHNSTQLGAPESEEACDRVAAASGRGKEVATQDMVGRCRLTVSKPVLKAPVVSALKPTPS